MSFLQMADKSLETKIGEVKENQVDNDVSLKVLLAESELAFRNYLRRKMEKLTDLNLVGEARDSREALLNAEKLRPDVVLMDMDLEGGSLEVARQIKSRMPQTRIIMLSTMIGEAYQSIAASSGVDTLLLKSVPVSIIFESFRRDRSNAGNPRKLEDSVEPPTDTVNNAKALFKILPFPEKQSIGSIFGQLVFDSAVQPMAAGVRSVMVTNRQLLFQKDTLFVDVRVEIDSDDSSIHIMGQLQDTKIAPGAMPAFKVALWHEGQTIAGTVSNEIGEFFLVGPSNKKLQLRIDHNQQHFSFDLQNISQEQKVDDRFQRGHKLEIR